MIVSDLVFSEMKFLEGSKRGSTEERGRALRQIGDSECSNVRPVAGRTRKGCGRTLLPLKPLEKSSPPRVGQTPDIAGRISSCSIHHNRNRAPLIEAAVPETKPQQCHSCQGRLGDMPEVVPPTAARSASEPSEDGRSEYSRIGYQERFAPVRTPYASPKAVAPGQPAERVARSKRKPPLSPSPQDTHTQGREGKGKGKSQGPASVPIAVGGRMEEMVAPPPSKEPRELVKRPGSGFPGSTC